MPLNQPAQAPPGRSAGPRRRGIRANRRQLLLQLLQVLLVGMTIGMMRAVVPALAESEFGVPRGSFMLLVATWAMASGRWGWARPLRWAAISKARSGSLPSRGGCQAPCCNTGAKRRTRA